MLRQNEAYEVGKAMPDNQLQKAWADAIASDDIEAAYGYEDAWYERYDMFGRPREVTRAN